MQFGEILKNDYSINLITDQKMVKKTYRSGYYYYFLPTTSNYQLKLTNNNQSRCDAHVYLGSIKLGIYRIQPYTSVTISSNKLVFNRENSFVQGKYNIACNAADQGLIKVIFKPEADSCGIYGCGHNCLSNMPSFSLGASKRCDCHNCKSNCCLFGPDNGDQMNDSYMTSLRGKQESAKLNNKMVPILKDIDSSRVMELEARLASI